MAKRKNEDEASDGANDVASASSHEERIMASSPKMIRLVDNVSDHAESKSKRVRKKSAKLIEMEEAEALERKMFKSPLRGGAAKTPKRAVPEVKPALSPLKQPEQEVKSPPPKEKKLDSLPMITMVDSQLQTVQTKDPSPAKKNAKHKETQPIVKTEKPAIRCRKQPKPASKTALKIKQESTKLKQERINSKQDDTSTVPTLALPEDTEIRLEPEVYPSVSIKHEAKTAEHSGLKLKLCLNSSAHAAPPPPVNIKTDRELQANNNEEELEEDENQPAIWPTKDIKPKVKSLKEQVVVKLKKKKRPKKVVENAEVPEFGTKKEEMLKQEGEPQQEAQQEIAQVAELEVQPGLDNQSEEGQLVIDDTVMDVKAEHKMSKKKRKKKEKQQRLKQEAEEKLKAGTVGEGGGMEGSGPGEDDEELEVDEDDDGSGIRPVSLYSNTAAMALKVKTSSEKKATGSARDKKDKLKKKKFRRSGPTAYTVFCNNYRYKVVAENPGSDFAQISRRLGEIWQCLPAKEKMFWKRKARQRLNRMRKEAEAIALGKLKPSTSTNTVTVPTADHAALVRHGSKKARGTTTTSTRRDSIRQPIPVPATVAEEMASSTLLGQLLTSHTEPVTTVTTGEMKADPTTPCHPIDVAAHLKLLGDSLHTIGSKLQETRVPITVQGSLSVLLDTSLCAMGSLMCLTNQLPELKTIPDTLHSENLDNIAYIMPGIG